MESPLTDLQKRPLVSYGVTLSRVMTQEEQQAVADTIDAEKLIGHGRIAVLWTNTPNVVNVEFFSEGSIGAISAIVSCEVVAKRLRTLHQYSPESLTFTPVDLYDAQRIRNKAESIVDYIRSGSLPRFDQSRENCVRMLMAELADASRLVDKI